MGAWIGWHDCDPSSRPTVAGQAFLGKRGTQQAEYLAAIHGLQAVLASADLEIVPEQLILHVDNKWLANVLEGFWVADKLRSYDRHAKQIVSALEALGVEFFVDRVSEGHAQHKAAHRMSKAAWNQVFDELTWRPAPRPSAPRGLPQPPPGPALRLTSRQTDRHNEAPGATSARLSGPANRRVAPDHRVPGNDCGRHA